MGCLKIPYGLAQMSQMRIACFATSDANHFIGVFAVASGLIEIGACVRIWTDKRFRRQIMAAGIEFGDLLESGTIDDADPLSIPRADCRFFSAALRSINANRQ